MKTTRTITLTGISLLLGVSFMSQSFAAVPAFGPDGVSSAGGTFATYFENFAYSPCATGTGVLTGVSSSSSDFLTGECTDIADILANFLGSYPVQSGKGVVGFSATTGEPLFGNVGSPSLSGWYLTGNLNTDPVNNFVGTTDLKDLRFRTDNIERLNITSVGDIGIGTSAPITKLDVIGGIRTSSIISSNATAPGFYLQDSDNRGVGFYTLTNKFYLASTQTGTRTPTATPMTIDLNTGNMGIGNSSPALRLDVAGYIRSSSGIVSRSTIPTLYLHDTDSKGVALYTGTNKFYLYSTLANSTTIVPTNPFTMDLITGNVGIGTATPGSRLEVAGQVKITGGSPGAGKVLRSDASGLASWVTTGSLMSESDPRWTAQKSLYATLASPIFTGDPKAPTRVVGDNDTSIATTAFVTSAIGLKANIASPIFTGNPTAPSPALTDNDTSIATTAFVKGSLGLKANLASPIFTGTPSLPIGAYGVTQAAGNNTTALATTAFVTTANNLKANLASPIFTGNPTAPSPAASDNDTSIATTAFVTSAIGLKANIISPNFSGNPTAPSPAASDNDTSIATTQFVKSLGYITTSGVAAAETDPQVGANSTDYIPKWDGTALVAGTIRDVGGKIGIGVVAPFEKVEVNGNVKAIAFMYTSDEKLKKNITPIKNIDEILSALRGVKFEWKDTGKKDIGFIAQEVEKILPEIVHTGNDDMKSVEYANITALLVEGYKYQKTRADELEKRIEKLEQSTK